MAGVLDFLFEGRPPPSVGTFGQTVESLPPWLADYTQGLIARANAIAAEPYQAYAGPRIAGFSPDQAAGFQTIRNNVGNYRPELDLSSQLTSSATGEGGLSQAMPFLTAAGQGFNELANPERSTLGAASPFIAQAARQFPSQVGQYMNPFIDNVISRGSQLANRNYEENILPSIEGRFVRAGQYGSSAALRESNRAGRDLTEGLNSQNQAALADAYRQASGDFQADQSRIAGLGTLTGNLAGLDRSAIEASAQGLGTTGINIGNLNFQQADRQREAAGQLSGLAQLRQALSTRDAAGLDTIGQQQQQLGQRNLDLAYEDFQRQTNYPRENIDFLSRTIRGLPSQSVTTQTGVAPGNNFQPSPLAQFASILLANRGLQDAA